MPQPIIQDLIELRKFKAHYFIYLTKQDICFFDTPIPQKSVQMCVDFVKRTITPAIKQDLYKLEYVEIYPTSKFKGMTNALAMWRNQIEWHVKALEYRRLTRPPEVVTVKEKTYSLVELVTAYKKYISPLNFKSYDVNKKHTNKESFHTFIVFMNVIKYKFNYNVKIIMEHLEIQANYFHIYDSLMYRKKKNLKKDEIYEFEKESDRIYTILLDKLTA